MEQYIKRRDSKKKTCRLQSPHKIKHTQNESDK